MVDLSIVMLVYQRVDMMIKHPILGVAYVQRSQLLEGMAGSALTDPEGETPC